MQRCVGGLLVSVLAMLAPSMKATAADEKAVEAVAEFVATTTVEVKKWKAAWLCDASAMQATIMQCRMHAGDLKSAAEKVTQVMKAPLAKLQSNLALLGKEFPESHGVRCRAEWIDIIGCHAQLGLGAVVLRGKLRVLEAK